MAESSSEPTLPIGRLRWRCRRGMRELDVLLARYLDHVYPVTDERRRQAFEFLLEQQDPLILAYVVGNERPTDPDLLDVIEQLTRVGT